MPSTFSALAFEQVNDISGQGIEDNPDKFEFLAATAHLVGPVFDNSDLLAAKYLHGSLHGWPPAQMKYREMLMLLVPEFGLSVEIWTG